MFIPKSFLSVHLICQRRPPVEEPIETREVMLCDAVAKMLFAINMALERYVALLTALREVLRSLNYRYCTCFLIYSIL